MSTTLGLSSFSALWLQASVSASLVSVSSGAQCFGRSGGPLSSFPPPGDPKKSNAMRMDCLTADINKLKYWCMHAC